MQYTEHVTLFVGVDHFSGARLVLTRDQKLERPTRVMWFDEINQPFAIVYPRRKTSVYSTKIRYSTPRITPLTILLLKPISHLSGIDSSTIHDHRGPHQSLKMVAHTPQKTPFSLASLFLWLKSGSPPQK